eukprot:10029953-Heterocapsa_arctica.AAC.1
MGICLLTRVKCNVKVKLCCCRGQSLYRHVATCPAAVAQVRLSGVKHDSSNQTSTYKPTGVHEQVYMNKVFCTSKWASTKQCA